MELKAERENEIKVRDRLIRGHQVLLKAANAVEPLLMRRFVPVGGGDVLVRRADGYFVRLKGSDREVVRITPAWTQQATLDFGTLLEITVKEVETEEELEGYRRLTEHHYRGAGGAGRRVPLVATAELWELPRVVGFIELSSTFIVNSARASILDSSFSDPTTGIAWTHWDSKTAEKFSNTFVRISRCVVFPELRGLGLSTLLVNAAVEYARDRWHLGGLRPSFIEITAEMLRYWPFVKKSGFVFAGETEGNQHRAAQDMKYLLGRKAKARGLPQGGGGIMSAQRAYATRLSEVMSSRKLTIDQIITFLQRSPDKLSDEEWVALHRVFRRPKPTYIRGLTVAATEFLHRRAGIAISSPTRPSTAAVKKVTHSYGDPVLELQHLGIEIAATPTSSAEARRVQEAFGIVATEFRTTLVENWNLVLRRGDVLLIGGPSGSGKSLLLRSIRYLAALGRDRGRLPTGLTVSGRRVTNRIQVALPRHVPSEQAPIELLSNQSLEDGLRVLASAGLAEPQLFVRPAKTLSVGQGYRLSIALALASNPELLLIDEFCEPLDQLTAAAVARRLRDTAQKSGMAIIAATADPKRIVAALQPTRLVLLSSDGRLREFENVSEPFRT